MYKIIDDNISMEDLLASSAEFLKPELGSVIEGEVISVSKNKLVIDLNGVAVGMASGKETHDSMDTIADLKAGDKVKTVVIEEEDDDGMVVLSLKKASQSLTWDKFEGAYKDGDIIQINVSEANKGGLLIDVDGIKGFIPVSQLAPIHYPRVEDGNAGQILTRLQKLVGTRLDVKIINLDRDSGKMILSEKSAIQSDASGVLDKLKVGDRVTGRVSGVVKFGIFVTFEGLEGLVHISEIAWGHVSNPHQYAKIGDEVEVEVIGIEGEKLSLSMKRLIQDPWGEIEAKYPIGSKVKGTINRFSQFGAFVQLENDINGLIHLSEISNQKIDNPEDFLSTGEEVEAQVINIDREEHRIGLSIKAIKPAKRKSTSDADEEAKEEVAEKATEEEEKKENKKKPKKEEKVEEEEAEAEAEEKEEKPKKKAAKKADKKDDDKEADVEKDDEKEKEEKKPKKESKKEEKEEVKEEPKEDEEK